VIDENNKTIKEALHRRGCGGPDKTTAAVDALERQLQTSLDGLVKAGFPAALGSVTGADGETVDLASGARVSTATRAQCDSCCSTPADCPNTSSICSITRAV
jgi:hypothetical protein